MVQRTICLERQDPPQKPTGRPRLPG